MSNRGYTNFNVLVSTLKTTKFQKQFWQIFTCVSALIGRHIASFATLMNPIATSSMLISDLPLFVTLSPPHCDWLAERKWLISLVSFWKWLVVSSLERGSFSPGPKMWGKNEGSRRPRAKLASVTVRGPPIGQTYYINLLQYWAKELKSTWSHENDLEGLVWELDTGGPGLFLKYWHCSSQVLVLVMFLVLMV